MKTRDEALSLLRQYTESDALLKHAYAVEAVMRRFAARFGEDPDAWGLVGLLHDVDYEKWPDDVKPELPVEKTIYTIDELTGLITAAALMRPSRSVMDMEVKSVKKKFKDKHFAAGVNRDVILSGCDMLGMTLDDVIAESIEGMRAVHEALGL